MPKEQDRSQQDNNEQEPRKHRSSSHKRRSHKHGDGTSRHRSHRHRHAPYHRDKEPRSSTHIYFTGSDNVSSGSLRTDHVALASSLNSLMEQNGGMAKIFASCYKMLDQLRSDQIVSHGNLQQTTLTTSSTQRGVNHFNLASLPRSQNTVEHKQKPSFSGILASYKKTSLVPATQTQAQLHQSLSLHTEAKLDSIDISLLCPLTRARMATPVRGRKCTHFSCFDGESYLQLMWNKHVEKWKCPICKCLAPLSELVIDGYVMGILESVPNNVKSVEFTPDGYWKIKQGDCPLPSISKSTESTVHGNIIDLTFDTPEKKLSNAGNIQERDVPPVIDLTLSP